MKPQKKTVYEWFLVVEGASEFPFDMLRYDACFPFEQEDSAKLQSDKYERRRVVLIRRGVNDSAGNEKRWASFGWRVLLATNSAGEATDLRKQS